MVLIGPYNSICLTRASTYNEYEFVNLIRTSEVTDSVKDLWKLTRMRNQPKKRLMFLYRISRHFKKEGASTQ